MAGALSGHLVQSYESVANQSICTDGQISFNPSMHRSFNPNMYSTQQSMAFHNASHTFSSSTSESVFDRIGRLQSKLNQKLGPEFISQRPGPGGGPKLTYAEGWKIINIANDVFGFDGWSSNIVNMTTDYMDYNEESRRYNVGISVIMRVTLKEGVYHEDVGYGTIENAKGKGMALDKVRCPQVLWSRVLISLQCKKEAVTDALKRTLRTFGNVLGNCLYDKQYTAEIVKIKVPPVRATSSIFPVDMKSRTGKVRQGRPSSHPAVLRDTCARCIDNYIHLDLHCTRPCIRGPATEISAATSRVE